MIEFIFKVGKSYRLRNGDIAECLSIEKTGSYPIRLLTYYSSTNNPMKIFYVSEIGRAKNMRLDNSWDVIEEYTDNDNDNEEAEEIKRSELRLTYRDETDGLIYLVNDKELKKLARYKLSLKRYPCALDERGN